MIIFRKFFTHIIFVVEIAENHPKTRKFANIGKAIFLPHARSGVGSDNSKDVCWKTGNAVHR